MRFQCASSSSRSASPGRPTAEIDFGQPLGSERAGLGRMGDRGRKRADREIWPLRQRHHLGSAWHR